MSSAARRTRLHRPLILFVCAAGLIVLRGCGKRMPPPNGDTPPPGDGGPDQAACSVVIGTPDLACAAPPDTFATTSLSGTDNGRAWDAWAWSSFVALNWPALRSRDAHTFPTGYVRGVPDTSRSFAQATATDVTVWETFKEKRELFNPAATADAWQRLTYDPTFAPVSEGGQIEMCQDADRALLKRLGGSPRRIAQLGKQDASAGGASSVDETAEVASPAQESTNDLCAGYAGSSLTSCRSILFPPPAPDAYDKPYSSFGPNSRQPVGPRVFKGKPSADGFIYYEVKLNYDYYAYVAGNSLNDYDMAQGKARHNQIRLPWRTSAGAKPGPSNTDAVTGYDAEATEACYRAGLTGCVLPNQSGISPAKLPAIGSVQLKAAWLPAAQLDGDPADYHLTEAVYYRDSPQQPNGLCYDAQQFGLIGLHIIQRVHGGASGTAEGIGGTYIFATWEHESIADGAGYSYVNYFANAGGDQTNPKPYPNTADGMQVARLQNYPLPSTASLNAKVQGQIPDSVWKRYRLIGTQFLAVGTLADSIALGQPYYLANLVIETNRGLQQFQGQPPGQKPNDHFKQAGVPENFQFFAPTSPNMLALGKPYVMGGCMGCHGVAQSQGFAFSFVLQDGSKGTRPDTAQSIAIPPIPVPATMPTAN